MALKQASPLVAAADNKSYRFHSRKRLQYLTKAAVDKACKLHDKSTRFVHIVDTQSCGSSKGHGLFNPFSSLSSALIKKSSTASPSPSRQWALSKGSDDRRAVAGHIHSLLLEWKADSSFQWRARVASAVPVLEEAFYKGAKSKEEYMNPQLLESQLIHVLCHFEAGNGPFLLQGSTPLYSVRACSPSTVASLRMSFFHQSPFSHGLPTNEEVSELASSEQTCERARPSCSRSSASGVSSNSIAVGFNVQEAVNICQVDAMEERPSNHRVHSSNGLVKKVANMLATKKRRDSGVCVTQELGSAHAGLERAGDLAEDDTSDALLPDRASSCSTDERRRTLGGILKLNNFIDATTQGVLIIDAEEASIARSRADEEAAEAPSLPSNMRTVATQKLIRKFPVGSQCTLDSRTSEEAITPFLVSSDEGSTASVAPRVVINELLANQGQGAHCGGGSFLSFISSSSVTPVSSSSSSSSSASPPSSSFTPAFADAGSIELHHSEPIVAGELGAHNAQSSSAGARPRVPSPPASSNDTSSKTIERGLKLPLRRFLAEREEFKGGVSRYVDGGCPWETWEEATEQLDGMCCVCMVGLKGAAFIPCGHTFCRKCSRELWRGRGTCPLCNRYIREILDIY